MTSKLYDLQPKTQTYPIYNYTLNWQCIRYSQLKLKHSNACWIVLNYTEMYRGLLSWTDRVGRIILPIWQIKVLSFWVTVKRLSVSRMMSNWQQDTAHVLWRTEQINQKLYQIITTYNYFLKFLFYKLLSSKSNVLLYSCYSAVTSKVPLNNSKSCTLTHHL